MFSFSGNNDLSVRLLQKTILEIRISAASFRLIDQNDMSRISHPFGSPCFRIQTMEIIIKRRKKRTIFNQAFLFLIIKEVSGNNAYRIRRKEQLILLTVRHLPFSVARRGQFIPCRCRRIQTARVNPMYRRERLSPVRIFCSVQNFLQIKDLTQVFQHSLIRSLRRKYPLSIEF